METRPEKRTRPIEPLPFDMHPTLWAFRRAARDWRIRALIEGAALAVVLWLLRDAPRWASVLAIYIATRASRVDASADLGALQDTLRETRP